MCIYEIERNTKKKLLLLGGKVSIASAYITIDIQHIRVTLIFGSLNVTIYLIWEFAIIFIATQTVNILEDFPMDSSSYCFYKKYPIVNLNISTSETETSDSIWYIVQYKKILVYLRNLLKIQTIHRTINRNYIVKNKHYAKSLNGNSQY